jgi:hypothetical protein
MRRILLPDEADFSQEYWMSFKKNRGSMAAKDPLVGRIDNFQTGPNKKPEIRVATGRQTCRPVKNLYIISLSS